MTAIFVTGSGTDVGKTFITAALIRHLRERGRAVDAIKPVISGFDSAQPQASDTGRLLAALGRPVTPVEIHRVSPWRFAAPLAPDQAARLEGRALDFSALVDFCQEAMDRSDLLFIEGVGGVMVPLDRSRTVLDWMTALRVPVLVVVGSYLGTISHTLTALHVLAQRNLDIAAVVVSASPEPAPPLADTAAAIARFVFPIEVVAVPRLARGDGHPAIERIARLLT